MSDQLSEYRRGFNFGVRAANCGRKVADEYGLTPDPVNENVSDWRDIAAELAAALFVDDVATRVKAMKMYAQAVLLEHRDGRV